MSVSFDSQWHRNRYVGAHIERAQDLVNKLTQQAAEVPRCHEAVKRTLEIISVGLQQRDMASIDVSVIEFRNDRAQLYANRLAELCRGEEFPTHYLDGAGNPVREISPEDAQTMRTILVKECISKVKEALATFIKTEEPVNKRAKREEAGEPAAAERANFLTLAHRVEEKQACRIAIQNNPALVSHILRGASAEIRSDKAFLKELIDQYPEFIGRILRGASADVQVEIQSDKILFIYLIQQHQGYVTEILKEASAEIRSDKEFLEDLIDQYPKHRGRILGGASAELQSDKAFFMELIRRRSWCIDEILKEASADVRAAIRSDQAFFIDLLHRHPNERYLILKAASPWIRGVIQGQPWWQRKCVIS